MRKDILFPLYFEFIFLLKRLCSYLSRRNLYELLNCDHSKFSNIITGKNKIMLKKMNTFKKNLPSMKGFFFPLTVLNGKGKMAKMDSVRNSNINEIPVCTRFD